MSELILIIILGIIFLKPKDIEYLAKNLTIVLIKINKYITQIKNDFLKF